MSRLTEFHRQQAAAAARGLQMSVAASLEVEDTSGAATVVTGSGVGLATPPLDSDVAQCHMTPLDPLAYTTL
jgi:hypothetical protein